ncbi:MAG: hypothetical protein EB127_16145 [Alphaproteobacteria bacterium]|nr:hypothetical protein [Alphaproteobacteria bacterium]
MQLLRDKANLNTIHNNRDTNPANTEAPAGRNIPDNHGQTSLPTDQHNTEKGDGEHQPQDTTKNLKEWTAAFKRALEMHGSRERA